MYLLPKYVCSLTYLNIFSILVVEAFLFNIELLEHCTHKTSGSYAKNLSK